MKTAAFHAGVSVGQRSLHFVDEVFVAYSNFQTNKMIVIDDTEEDTQLSEW